MGNVQPPRAWLPRCPSGMRGELAIRDGIIMLFSTKTEDDLLLAEGKEKFRAEILKEIRDTLEELTGTPGVEAVYFSNFVMQ